jgi:hypothetical protein
MESWRNYRFHARMFVTIPVHLKALNRKMKTLAYISAFTVLIPAAFGLIKLKYAGKTMKMMIFYLFVCVFIESLTGYMTYLKINNALVASIFCMFEGLFLISFFSRVYGEPEFRIPAIFLGAVYLGYGCYTTFFDPGPMVFNGNYRAAESLMVQAMTAYALIKISKEENLQLMQHPEFWISAGFFIYFSVNLAVFLTANFLEGNNISVTKNTWIIHSLINIGANLIFTFGLLCIPRPQHR